MADIHGYTNFRGSPQGVPLQINHNEEGYRVVIQTNNGERWHDTYTTTIGTYPVYVRLSMYFCIFGG
ncbi:MAG: hypothetical protein PHC48_07605 [Prevotella sp.]|nr:hypothetical protein [Prevotella sp.]